MPKEVEDKIEEKAEEKKEKSEIKFKPFVDSAELPEPTVKKTGKVNRITKTGEPRYFLRDNGLSYSLIAIVKKLNGSISKKQVSILKKKNPAHKIQYKKLIAQKIPVLE